jgi:hypothetical protein
MLDLDFFYAVLHFLQTTSYIALNSVLHQRRELSTTENFFVIATEKRFNSGVFWMGSNILNKNELI